MRCTVCRVECELSCCLVSCARRYESVFGRVVVARAGAARVDDGRESGAVATDAAPRAQWRVLRRKSDPAVSLQRHFPQLSTSHMSVGCCSFL